LPFFGSTDALLSSVPSVQLPDVFSKVEVFTINHFSVALAMSGCMPKLKLLYTDDKGTVCGAAGDAEAARISMVRCNFNLLRLFARCNQVLRVEFLTGSSIV
jgi:hypothetical protein